MLVIFQIKVKGFCAKPHVADLFLNKTMFVLSKLQGINIELVRWDKTHSASALAHQPETPMGGLSVSATGAEGSTVHQAHCISYLARLDKS